MNMDDVKDIVVKSKTSDYKKGKHKKKKTDAAAPEDDKNLLRK